jgi:hypothetical protein
MTPEQRAQAERMVRERATGHLVLRSGDVVYGSDDVVPVLAAALAHIDALEARVGQIDGLEARLEVVTRHALAARARVKEWEAGFAPYLKEDETPLERLERERKDNLALMSVLGKRTQERDDEQARADRAEAERDETIRGRDAVALLLAKAEARLKELEEDARRILNEDCAPDEKHCSCVPHLRAAKEQAEAERDRLQEALEAEVLARQGQTCGTCRHWAPTPGGVRGDCCASGPVTRMTTETWGCTDWAATP